MPNKGLIFLNGFYDHRQPDFYRLEADKFGQAGWLVAADGALVHLDKLGIKPQVLLGDLDSCPAALLTKYHNLLLVRYPPQKDYTDGELAVRYCLSRGCRQIQLTGALDRGSEPDQMLGNLGLLVLGQRLARQKKLACFEISIKEPDQEIYYLDHTDLALPTRQDSLVSIIPLAQRNWVKYQGFAYPPSGEQVLLRFGQSKGLRNRIVQPQARLEVQGRAWVVVHGGVGED